MWVNPRFREITGREPPGSASTTKAPEPAGETLVVLRRGQGVELRIAMAEFQGRAYVSVRVFEQGHDGAFYPARGKGCSLRLSELPAIVEALGRVAAGTPDREPAPTPRDDPDRPRYAERAGRRHDRADFGGLPPAPTASTGEFSEF